MRGIGLTDVGNVRTNNEDTIFVSHTYFGSLPNLYILADGMGGHKAGEVASGCAVEYFCEYVQNNTYAVTDLLDFILDAIVYANRKVYEKSLSDEQYSEMGTTFSVCVFSDGKVYIAHIGDSRVYIVGGGVITQLTTDHTYVNEMVKAGTITQDQAENHPNRNIITRALGMDSEVAVDARVDAVYPGDQVFLCSDGLSDMVSDQAMYDVLTNGSNVEDSARTLVELAKQNGGVDNISIVLVSIER